MTAPVTGDKWYYIKGQAERLRVKFLRCDGVLYEVSKSHYATGPSPLWDIEEVHVVDIPAFLPDPPDDD
jgi:hypothetical protein